MPLFGSILTVHQLAEIEPWHGFSCTSDWTPASQLLDRIVRTVRTEPNKGTNKQDQQWPIVTNVAVMA